MTTAYELSEPRLLEAESVHVFSEVAATFERPALLFSGGKDSVVMLHLAAKAFWPAPVPFPVMHVDTGHNFDEVIEFRDRAVARFGVRLVVAAVQDDIDAGRVVEETGPRASRNRLQTVTLLDAITEHGFDAVFGGGRRDEITAFMSRRLGPEIITVHTVGQPEIDIDGNEATGTWAMQDIVIATEHHTVIQGAAFYEDRYRRGEDGVWRISHTGYDRTYEAMIALKDLPAFKLTANRWAAAR